MIAMYHKIDIVSPTIWWATPRNLLRHINELRRFEFVYLDDYDPANPRHVVLTFDDAYENFYHHAYPILKRLRIPFELFVIGDLIGEWNQFDDGEPLTRFAGMDQLCEIADGGGRVQWHTRSHPALHEVSDAQIDHELTVPDEIRAFFPAPHMRWFSYPFGLHDERSVGLARKKFAGAVSVVNGEREDRWQLNRVLVHDRWSPPDKIIQ